MFCPKCLTEYREGFIECADCHVPLQATKPSESEESFPTLVGVLDTTDNFALASATTALRDAGIVYDVVDIADLPKPIAQQPKWWISPCRILVATEDTDEARTLLEPFQEPLAGDFSAESEPDHDY